MPERDPPTTAPGLDASFRLVRSALANLRAAAETLDAFPELEIERRSRLLRVLVDESQRLSHAVVALEAETRARSGQPHPASVDEALAAVGGALAAAGLGVETVEESAPGPGATVSTPLADLGAEIESFARGLRRELGVATLRLGHGQVESYLRLDLSWRLDEGEDVRATTWVPDAIAAATTGGSGAGLRSLLREHGGEVWFTIERDGSAAHVRMLLPLFSPHPGAE